MKKVNTKSRIKSAGLELFLEHGYAGTSIAAIEKAAGLAPRAGAFYRHFDSKEALLEELAREKITETPAEFDFEGLLAFDDTRAELIAIARQYELAGRRQQRYRRLIDEVRLTGACSAFEQSANEEMAAALCRWLATKKAARELDEPARLALALNIFGGWLFYLGKRFEGVSFPSLTDDDMRRHWANLWAGVLDNDYPG